METLWSIGALLGAAAFGWEAWREFTDRSRRRWGDDLRAVLVRLQPELSEVARSPKDMDWSNEHLRPLEKELLEIAQRMLTTGRTGLMQTRVDSLASKVGLCHTYSEIPELTNRSQAEVSVRASQQVEAAKKALEKTLFLLRRL